MKYTYNFYVSMACLCAGAWMPAIAEHLTPDQSLARVSHIHHLPAAAKNVEKMHLIAQMPQVYVFSSGNGFVVTSAESGALPLLGYADSGRFDDNPSLRYWIETYSREIDYAVKNGFAHIAADRPQRTPVSPLIRTRWNQEAPYNDLCPELNGKRCVTGCVATCMAQGLRYYSYPAKGSGSHSYYWKTGAQNLSFDYGSTTFDWELMPYVYDSASTPSEKTQVATLMKACGVGVNMMYDPSDSGAYSRDMVSALVNYFGYDKSMWMPERNYYGLIDWENLVYGELAQGRPVLYGGQGADGGHQFICDGYNADGYFHFNWGWGGLSDGYFLLTALDPPALGTGGGSGGFNFDQSIAVNFMPSQVGSEYKYVMYCGNGFTPYNEQTSVGSQVSFGSEFYNFSFANLPSDASVGIEIVGSNGESQYVADYSAAGVQPLQGFNYISPTIPNLSDGQYKIYPAFKANGKVERILCPLSSAGYAIANVSSGYVELSSPQTVNLNADGLQLNSDIYSGMNVSLTFNVTNQADSEYLGGVIPVLLNTSGTSIVASTSEYPLDLEAGASQTLDVVNIFYPNTSSSSSSSTSATQTTGQGTSSVSPGNYLLGIYEPTSQQLISQTIPVTVNAAPAETAVSAQNFRLLSDSETITNPADAKFGITLICSEGYFADNLQLMIFPEQGGADIDSASSDVLFLNNGDSKDVEFKIDLSKLSKGTYFAVVYAGQRQLTNPLLFRIDDKSGITPITEVNSQSGIYNLQGIRLSSPYGVYIKNRKVILGHQ